MVLDHLKFGINNTIDITITLIKIATKDQCKTKKANRNKRANSITATA